jgi:hypothetical protein
MISLDFPALALVPAAALALGYGALLYARWADHRP